MAWNPSAPPAGYPSGYDGAAPLDPHESDCPACGKRRMPYEERGEYCEACGWQANTEE